MRPTRIISMVAAIVLGVVMLAAGVLAVVNATSGKPWYFWLAPLLVIGAAGLLLALAVGYYVQVGRLEARGRPAGG